MSCSGHEAYTHLSVSVKPDRTVLRSSARHSAKASELHMGAMTLSVYVQTYDKIGVNDDTIIRMDPHSATGKNVLLGPWVTCRKCCCKYFRRPLFREQQKTLRTLWWATCR